MRNKPPKSQIWKFKKHQNLPKTSTAVCRERVRKNSSCFCTSRTAITAITTLLNFSLFLLSYQQHSTLSKAHLNYEMVLHFTMILPIYYNIKWCCIVQWIDPFISNHFPLGLGTNFLSNHCYRCYGSWYWSNTSNLSWPTIWKYSLFQFFTHVLIRALEIKYQVYSQL